MANMLQENTGGWITMTSGVGAGVYGAYTQAFAATANLNKWLWMAIGEYFAAAVDIDIEFSLATGLAGFEVDDYPDIYCRSGSRATQNAQPYNWPINIPAASRVALRAKDDKAGALTYHFFCTLTDTPLPPGDPVSSITVAPVTFTGSTGVDGPIVELVTSLAARVDYAMIYIQSITSVGSLASFDIMTGAAGLEFDRLGEMGSARNKVPTRHDSSMAYNGPVGWDAGERISCRIKASAGGPQFFRIGMILLTY